MLLRTEHLTKDYGNFRALDDLNLSIRAGEIFGVLGPNGSGKTTALRSVLGFLQPSRGAAYVADHHCWQDGVAARRLISYLPGELRLYENMTGRQLVSFLSQIRGVPIRAELDKLACRLDIDIDRPIANMSSGMKRKVALLQVLAPHTPLVILDEPTNTLDPNMRDELLVQLQQARALGQTVVFSSHVLSEVEQVCDRVAILRGGKLVHLHEMADLRESRVLKARFARPMEVPVALPGMQERLRCDDQIVWEHTGPLQPVLEWLGSLPLTDLSIEPLGLEAIYRRYHGNLQ